jgi:hypothetical protein
MLTRRGRTSPELRDNWDLKHLFSLNMDRTLTFGRGGHNSVTLVSSAVPCLLSRCVPIEQVAF